MQTVISNLLILICVVMLTACGLKGPLYLPDENPLPGPAPAQESESDETQKTEKEEKLEGSGGVKPSSG